MTARTEETNQDAILVRRAMTSDTAAMNQLVSQYFPMVLVVAYSHLHDLESAEEVAQEAFLRAYLNLQSLRDPKLFPAWINQIARNLALRWVAHGIRKSRLVSMVPISELRTEVAAMQKPSPRQSTADAEEKALIEKAVADLPPNEQEVVLLHFSAELSKSEIARQLGVHPSSVGRQLDKALARLRAALGPQLGGGRWPELKPQKGVAATALLIAAVTNLGPKAKAAVLAQALQDWPVVLPKTGSISQWFGNLAVNAKISSGLILVLAIGIAAYVVMPLRSPQPQVRPHSSMNMKTVVSRTAPSSPIASASRNRSSSSASNTLTVAATAWDNDAYTTESGIIITGRTLRTDGAPIPSAALFLYKEGDVSNNYDRTLYAQTVSDSDGNYAIEVNDYPVMTLMAHAPGFATMRAGVNDGHFYRKQTGKRLLQQDMLLPSSVPLSGHVVDEDGQPVLGATVGLGRGDWRTDETSSTEDGSFTLNAVAEKKLSVEVSSGSLYMWFDNLKAPSQDVVLTLPSQTQTGTLIEGRVYDLLTSTPVANASVRFNAFRGTAPTSSTEFLTTTDGSGVYRVANVPADVYSATAWKAPGLWRSPVNEFGDRFVRIEGTSVTLDLLVYAGRTISVIVVEGGTSRPLSGVLVRGGALYEVFPYVSVTDKEGRYSMQNVFVSDDWMSSDRNGTVILDASATGFALVSNRKDPRGLPKMGWPSVYRLKPHELAPTLDLEMLSVPVTTGTVRLPDGTPARGARVGTAFGGGIKRPELAATDANGQYAINMSPEGQQSIIVSAWGTAYAFASWDARTTPVGQQDFTLQQVVRFRGMVVNQDGKPVGGAVVTASSGTDLAWRNIGAIRTTTSDQTGHFEIPGIPSVANQVTGWKPDFQVGDTLKDASAKSEPLMLTPSPGEDVSGIRLVLIGAEK